MSKSIIILSLLYSFLAITKKSFINFFGIAKEEYNKDEIIIDFDIICEWLNVRKDQLKRLLVDKFDNKYDYSITKKYKNQINSTGKTLYYDIKITPNCFKEICMLSQTPKAKEVRKYFIELESLIKRYHEDIKESMYKKIGILETNQKPKVNVVGGILYILEVQNTDVTLYKLGKTTSLKNRLKTYNSGNANDVEPIFIIKVNDIDSVEQCVKNACKKFQYRKYKEVYEIDIDVLKEAIAKCNDLSNAMSRHLVTQKKNIVASKIKKMKSGNYNYFAYIDK